MELRNNPNVFFEPLTHTYLLGEKELTGVTTLLQKHHLMPDYSNIPDAVLNKAAEKGTALHKRIEDFDNGETFFQDEFIEQYLAVCQQNGLKFLVNELLVSDEELVASMIDGVYEGSKPDTVILVDYKSTYKIHWRALSWQLSVYRTLFERQFPGIKVEALKVLWLDKKEESVKGLYPVEPIPEEEVQALFEAERNGQVYVDLNDTPDLGEVLAPEEADALVANASKIAELEKALKTLKDADTAIRQKLLDYMTENNIAEIACPGGSFKVKAGYTRTGVDSKKLREMFPSVAARVETTTTVKPSLTFNPNK